MGNEGDATARQSMTFDNFDSRALAYTVYALVCVNLTRLFTDSASDSEHGRGASSLYARKTTRRHAQAHCAQTWRRETATGRPAPQDERPLLVWMLASASG